MGDRNCIVHPCDYADLDFCTRDHWTVLKVSTAGCDSTHSCCAEYPATSGDMSEQPAMLQTQHSEPAGVTSPNSMRIEVERQEPAGENAAAEQVFMYLQVRL